MLELTRQMTFVPGSNLKGQVAGANWAFLLPDLQLGRVVCLGVPSQRTLATLTLLAHDVTVVIPEGSPALPTRPNLTCLSWAADTDLPASLLAQKGQVDLLLVTGKVIRRLATQADELRALLAPRGWLYLELNTPLERLLYGQAALALAQVVGRPRVYWSTPLNGELHTAVPSADQETIDFFIRRGLYQPEVKKRLIKQALRLFTPRLVAHPLTRRHSLLVSPTQEAETAAPPRYLRELAAQSGLDIRRHRWGLVAHGQYSTRKVLVYLFRPGSDQPEYITKLVRDPAYNLRLENEHRALAALQSKDWGGANWFPRPAFFGQVNGLAVLGEAAVDGQDFRQRSRLTPDDPYARQAVQRLTQLAELTLDRPGASSTQVTDLMMGLLQQFSAIYRPEPEVRVFLENQIMRLGAQTLPLVFQHGDPGIWNMLVTRDERVVLLDWESAETGGIPLWDLFYFLRSYAVAAARKAGVRNPVQAFETYFFQHAEYSRFARQAIEQYCDCIGLPERMVEPLFYTCWMHRALKEANRLAPEKLPGGHYYNLLRVSIQRRATPALIRLFQSEPAFEVAV